MNFATRVTGISLVVVGVGGWALAGATDASPTALLPAALGLVILVLGLVASAQHEAPWSHHLVHAALVVAVLGFLGTLPNALPLLTGGEVETPIAAWSSLVTALICLGYVLLGVRSFVAARRARTS